MVSSSMFERIVHPETQGAGLPEYENDSGNRERDFLKGVSSPWSRKKETRQQRSPSLSSQVVGYFTETQLIPDADSIKHLDRPGRSGIEFGLAFVDAQDGLRAAENLRTRDESKSDVRVLLESPVLYEAVRPFLQAIQKIDPVTLPLGEYIRHGNLQGKPIALPEYATVPGFTWDLKGLLKPEYRGEGCSFDPSNANSIASAREVLHAHGKLDTR